MDAGVEIVDLGAEVDEVKLTSVEVKSNEPERSLVYPAVLADIDATHEAHVGVEEEGFGAAVGVGRGPRALHIGDPEETVEVGDRRRIDAGTEEDQGEIDPADVGGVGGRFGAHVGGFGFGKRGDRLDKAGPNRSAGGAAQEGSPRERMSNVVRG